MPYMVPDITTRLLLIYVPDWPFRHFGVQNPSWHVPELRYIRRSPDLDALKLWKARSGKCSLRFTVYCYLLSVKLIYPDEPFHSFGALKFVASHSWTTYDSLIRGFWGPKIGKGLVGIVHLPQVLTWPDLIYKKTWNTNRTSLTI